jgi:hypothetical protein
VQNRFGKADLASRSEDWQINLSTARLNQRFSVTSEYGHAKIQLPIGVRRLGTAIAAMMPMMANHDQ